MQSLVVALTFQHRYGLPQTALTGRNEVCSGAGEKTSSEHSTAQQKER